MTIENNSGKFLTNGNIINKYAAHDLKLSKGDSFYIENESYLGKFLVQEISMDAGVQFVRATGTAAGGDAIFDMAYLRRQYSQGQMKTYDKDGNLNERKG